MPTFDRRPFVPLAISHFLRQDYPESELLVIDDGTDPVEDLIPDDDRVQYHRLESRVSIGAKRNIGCRNATGDILVHWDDDDWYAPWRLSYQVRVLLESDADVCGLDNLLFWDVTTATAWRYRYPAARHPWIHDATFCYHRRLWERDPFPDASFGIDTQYLWRGPRKAIQSRGDSSFYVGIIHPSNTSPKRTRGSWWTMVPDRSVLDVLGDDAPRYAAAAGQSAGRLTATR